MLKTTSLFSAVIGKALLGEAPNLQWVQKELFNSAN